MTTVGQIYDFIDGFAPFRNQDGFDNSGLSVGSRSWEVKKVLLALDATVRIVEEAKKLGCELIVTHHPAIFHPTKQLDPQYPAALALSNGIACIGCHTSLDSAPYGVSDMMVDLLGFENLGVVPEINRRDPETGAPVGYGAMARCPKMSPKELAKLSKERFKSAALRWVDGGQDIETAACGSGACSEITEYAKALGAQAVITADVKLDRFLEAERLGITLIDAGHYETEVIALPYLRDKIAGEFNVECIISHTDGIVKGI